MARTPRTSSPRIGLPLARLARGPEADVRLRANRPDHERAGAPGERPGVVPRQNVARTATGVAALLGSLRPAHRSAGRPRSDDRVPRGRDGAGALAFARTAAPSRRVARGWRATPNPPRFCLHTLDLARPEEQIFRGFHASSTQRAIRRAEREGLSYEAGTSDTLLSAFYRLLRLTRRRHGLPPQPMAWFRNLIACIPSTRFARSGQGATIHVASKDGVPVAGILTLTFKTVDGLQVRRVGCRVPPARRHAVSLLARDPGGEGAGRRGTRSGPFGPRSARPDRLQGAPRRGAVGVDLLHAPGATCPTPSVTARQPASRAWPFVICRMHVLDLSGRLLYKHLG